MFILIGARIFSLTFYGVDGHKWVEHLLVSLPGGLYGFLVLVNAAVFLLAFFLDFFELAFIVVPLLKPAAEAVFRYAPEAIAIAKSFGLPVVADGAREMVADVGPFIIWFGVLLAVNMQTSFMHPPFGFALFYLRSVAPKQAYKDRATGRVMQPITTGDIYWGAVPFVIIQVTMVGLVLAFPRLVLSPPAAPAKTAPAAAASSPAPAIERSLAPGGLRLPGTPPAIPGAPAPPAGVPAAPTIDLSVPPRIEPPR
jgi:TRAP-type mannitol/chloroaromatic compound transport system permease large subunit